MSNEDEIISEIKSNWDGDGDPEDQFLDVIVSLNLIEEQGSEEESEHASTFLQEINYTVSEMTENRPPATEYEALEAEETAVDTILPTIRSIFDDLDE